MRLVYADESGDDKGLLLYAFIEVEPVAWSRALSLWLELRRALRDEFAIPTRYELHAVDFLGGRGNPSRDVDWNRRKGKRIAVGRRVTETLASMPIRIRVVYVNTTDRGRAYLAALENLEADLHRSNDLAMVMVDGDGSDPAYLEAHRSMPIETRRVLEDPWLQGSHTNQWIMMSDWVAYLAFQSLRRNNEVLSDWYLKFLAPLDVNGNPVRA